MKNGIGVTAISDSESDLEFLKLFFEYDLFLNK